MSNWHYMKTGVQTGPVTTDELRTLLASGALGGDTLVWREGLANWAAARTTTELADALPPAPVAAPAPGTFVAESADIEQNKIFGILSYLPPLLFLVPLLAARQSRFAMYHCNQGLVLTLVAFALGILNMILGMILVFIPYVGWLLMSVIHLGVFVGILVLAVLGLINAANGVCKPLPLIGHRFTLVK